jgi:hypothetical protein
MVARIGIFGTPLRTHLARSDEDGTLRRADGRHIVYAAEVEG